MKAINAEQEEARLLAEAIEAERLRVEEEARKAATAVYDDSPIVAKAYESETREATFDDVAALDVVPERPLMQFQLSRPADSIGEPRVFADLSAAVWKSTSASGAKSFLGNDAAVLARSSGEEATPPRHRRDACSTAWRCQPPTARPSQDGHVITEK